jgi:uncharacterized protein (TIGR00369 family)
MNKSEQLEHLNSLSKNNMVEHLGIIFTEIGNDYVCGKMPVDQRTIQPLGYLHGGASTAFAETLASVAGTMQVDIGKQYCMGMEINANHIKKIKTGWVYGKASSIHVGKRSQVWQIEITDENKDLVCISRMTLAVINR